MSRAPISSDRALVLGTKGRGRRLLRLVGLLQSRIVGLSPPDLSDQEATRSRSSASETPSSDAASGSDMDRVNHAGTLNATSPPGNLPRLLHKHRNLLAHAPDALHKEVTADYTDMIYAATPKAVQDRRRAFLRKWRLRCPEEAGGRLFASLRLPPSQSKSARTTNAIERLHEEFKRRIKT